MMRLGTALWLVLVLAAGFTTFKVKYAIQDTEDQLRRVRRQTVAELQEIRVLNAEWTYLNQPERLSELNRRFLGLASITTKQLQQTIGEIPLRALPAPPDVMTAASTVPAAPPTAPTSSVVTPAALNATPPVSGTLPPASHETARDAAEDTRPQPPIDPVPARPAITAPVQLAKAGLADTGTSLDALIAQIVETR